MVEFPRSLRKRVLENGGHISNFGSNKWPFQPAHFKLLHNSSVVTTRAYPPANIDIAILCVSSGPHPFPPFSHHGIPKPAHASATTVTSKPRSAALLVVLFTKCAPSIPGGCCSFSRTSSSDRPSWSLSNALSVVLLRTASSESGAAQPCAVFVSGCEWCNGSRGLEARWWMCIRG